MRLAHFNARVEDKRWERTVVIGLLEVHVDNSSIDDGGHIVGIKCSSLLPDTALSASLGVATVLCEEDGDRVVLEEFDLGLVSGALERTLSAPLVDVVTPEVDCLVLVAAVEVVSNILANVGIIVGGIADSHPTPTLALDVGLGVTHGSLDVGRRASVGPVVGDFVARKEANDVVVLAHLVHDSLVAAEQVNVPCRAIAVDG